MKKIKYVGGSHYREISEADFKSVGVQDQTGIRVAGFNVRISAVPDHTTPQEAEVSEAAAQWLLTFERADWQLVPEETIDESEIEPDADASLAPKETVKKRR